MRSVAISLDGVLRKPLDREAQDMGATLLYLALSQQFRVVILGTKDYERDKQWMMIQGLRNYVKIEPMMPEDHGQVTSQLRRLRAEGFIFEFLIMPDPELCLELIQQGLTVLLYTHPVYSPPSAKESIPWADLEFQVESDRLARAEAANSQ